MTPHLRLVRLSDDGARTLGVLEVYPRASDRAPAVRYWTLEPAWEGNARGVSCVPAGRYRVEPRTSVKYGRHLHVRGTEPARSLILFHAGNDRDDTRGCVLVGSGTLDVDRDGALDLVESRAALGRLVAACPKGATLDVVAAFRSAG